MEDVATISSISHQDPSNSLPDPIIPKQQNGEDDQALNGREKELASRNRNLDILNAYIQRQRSLLERIKLDIERLKESRQSVDYDPVQATEHILDLDNNDDNSTKGYGTKEASWHDVEKLSELVHQVIDDSSVTNDLDWGLFRGHDPTPIHSLPFYPSLPTQHIPIPITPNTPNPILIKPTLGSFIFPDKCWQPSSPSKPSPLGSLVRQKRAEWVEPALLEAQKYLETFPPDSDDECPKSARTKDGKEVAPRGKREQRRTRGRESRGEGTSRRRKSDNAALSALARPRGFGGRFKKLDQATNADGAIPNAADIQGSSSSNWHGFMPSSATSAVMSPENEGQAFSTSGRTQRRRRPLARYGSPTPSAVSAISAGSGSRRGRSRNGNNNNNSNYNNDGWRSSASASPEPEPPRVRLTIRIPPRSAFKGSSRGPVTTGNGPGTTNGNVHVYSMNEMVSASTSLTASTSHGTNGSVGGASASIVSGDYNENGIFPQRQNGNGTGGTNGNSQYQDNGNMDEDMSTYSPETAMSSARPSLVKEEESEFRFGAIDTDFPMDLVSRADRFKHSRYPLGVEELEEDNEKEEIYNNDIGDDDSEGDGEVMDEDVPDTPISALSPERSSTRRARNQKLRSKLSIGSSKKGSRRSSNYRLLKKTETPLSPSPSPNSATASTTTNSILNTTTTSTTISSTTTSGNGITPSSSLRRGDKATSSSRTYNQTWTEAEQRQLDMLLDRFPDGTKNRWSSISKAMGGSRTPRQVASRVQKYFLKMRKFGVDIT